MKDFSTVNVNEAASEEILIEFCEALKILDKDIIRRRLHAVYLSSGWLQRDFINIIAQFNYLIDTKTSVD